MLRVWFAVLSTLIMTVVILAWTFAAPSQTNGALSLTAKPGEWRYLNADPQSTRYSPLDQITKDNFKHLKIAWRWKPAIGRAPLSLGGTAQTNGDPTLARYKNEATPIIANGILYEFAVPSGSSLRSMPRRESNCGCGTAWTKTAATEKRRVGTQAVGCGYWTDGLEERIFVVTTGFDPVALNAKTGTPVREFGVNGAVDLMKELNFDSTTSRELATAHRPWSIATRSSFRRPSKRASCRPRCATRLAT